MVPRRFASDVRLSRIPLVTARLLRKRLRRTSKNEESIAAKFGAAVALTVVACVAAVVGHDRSLPTVKEAEEGSTTSKRVSGKLEEIAQAVGKVTVIVAEIAASAKEQAMGIEQVTRAVGEMDKVTQQNAASSEESSSAAEELSGQSEELASMVRTFRLERGTGPKESPGVQKHVQARENRHTVGAEQPLQALRA